VKQYFKYFIICWQYSWRYCSTDFCPMNLNWLRPI